ncbi:hypothetical protein C1646_717653 [Rhizophagus diaphanus]|nr:hypothetical protein C1646_717653 [Rhizophagus diaphanus] [Rhizophagus sp. MUCL 43196]
MSVRNFLISAKLLGIIIICAGGSEIDRRRYGWDNLFWKSSIVNGGENHVISNRSRNKLVIDIFRKCERAKK